MPHTGGWYSRRKPAGWPVAHAARVRVMNVGHVTSSAAGTEQVAEEVNLAVIASGIASERVRVNLRIDPCQEISDNPSGETLIPSQNTRRPTAIGSAS